MLKRSILIEKKASINSSYNQLLIKTEAREASIPIEDIGFVVIDHPETYISIPALNNLISNNCAVITCNQKHLPIGLFLNLDGHHIQQQLFRAQIEASIPLKKNLWQRIFNLKSSKW